MPHDKILPSILAELVSAEEKHPYWPIDIVHAASIVCEESGELIRAALNLSYNENGSVEEIKKEAIQTAATCIRLLKNLK